MNLSDLASYVGMITGVIGSVLGFLGYRTSKKHKSLDLRVQFKKELVNSVNLHQELCESLVATNSAKINIDAATGMSKSGGSEKWKKAYEGDRENLGELGKELAITHKSIEKMNEVELERGLIEIYRVKDQLERIKEKYSVVDSQIKEQVRARREEFNRKR